MEGLSRVQRDLLVVAAGFESVSAGKLKRELAEYYYSELSRQHVRNNLESLVADGYLSQAQPQSERVYRVTDRGEETIHARRD